MIRILFQGLTPFVGGTEVFTYNLIKNLDRSVFQCDFVTTHHDMAFTEEFKVLKCEFHYIKHTRRQNPIKNYFEVKRVISSGHYDFLYYNTCSASYIGSIKAAKKCKVATVVHSHNSGVQKLHTKVLHRINKKKLSRLTDISFACSLVAADWLFYKSKLRTETVIVNNGIDLTAFTPSDERTLRAKEALGLEGKKVIGHIGAFRECKNQAFLVQVFQSICEERHDAVLAFFGSGETMKTVKCAVEKAGLTDRVFFYGFRKDIDYVIHALDVFVLPSLFEGLPIVSIEAQAAGLPVVLSTAVTEEAVLTKYCVRLDLSEPASVWAETVNNFLDIQKCDNYNILKNVGYDVADAVKTIAEMLECYQMEHG
ncbi:MAG: glycosyltransferase [Firmicutes bacterium]|nr:glycosyltransferase [Bacillota bacterium]